MGSFATLRFGPLEIWSSKNEIQSFVRESIEASAAALDAEIDRQIDAARGG